MSVIADRALAEGLSSLGVEAIGGTAAASFYASLGFMHAYTEMRSILELALGRLAAHRRDGRRAGPRLPGRVLRRRPARRAARRPTPRRSRCAASTRPGDLDLRPSSYDADRLRASLRCLTGRGLRPYIVVAVHERSEKVAALTELVVPAHAPDPGRPVRHDHRAGAQRVRAGRGRSRPGCCWSCARPSPSCATCRPGTPRTASSCSRSTRSSASSPDREWREYEVDASDLAARLRVPRLVHRARSRRTSRRASGEGQRRSRRAASTAQ